MTALRKTFVLTIRPEDRARALSHAELLRYRWPYLDMSLPEVAYSCPFGCAMYFAAQRQTGLSVMGVCPRCGDTGEVTFENDGRFSYSSASESTIKKYHFRRDNGTLRIRLTRE